MRDYSPVRRDAEAMDARDRRMKEVLALQRRRGGGANENRIQPRRGQRAMCVLSLGVMGLIVSFHLCGRRDGDALRGIGTRCSAFCRYKRAAREASVCQTKGLIP